MKKILLTTVALITLASSFAFGREARLVRYPHYHNDERLQLSRRYLDRQRKRRKHPTLDRQSSAMSMAVLA